MENFPFPFYFICQNDYSNTWGKSPEHFLYYMLILWLLLDQLLHLRTLFIPVSCSETPYYPTLIWKTISSIWRKTCLCNYYQDSNDGGIFGFSRDLYLISFETTITLQGVNTITTNIWTDAEKPWTLYA